MGWMALVLALASAGSVSGAVVTVDIGKFPDGTTVPTNEIITSQYRDVGILFSGRRGLSNTDPVSLFIGGSGPDPRQRWLFNTPDVHGVVYQFDFVLPGTSTAAEAVYFQISPDFDSSQESLGVVGLDGQGNVVSQKTVTPGSSGYYPLVSISAPIGKGFSRVEVRTNGNPGIGFLGTHENGLRFALTPLLGDANGDGQVDGNDLIAVEENFGSVGELGLIGDANLDGQVDGNDLIAVEENFGATDPYGTPVPEPLSAMLLACGAAALLRRGGIRQQGG